MGTMTDPLSSASERFIYKTDFDFHGTCLAQMRAAVYLEVKDRQRFLTNRASSF